VSRTQDQLMPPYVVATLGLDRVSHQIRALVLKLG
jgi:hypothetical protein